MGTDIHLYVERRNEAGVWELIPPPPPTPIAQRTGPNIEYCWGPHGCMRDHDDEGAPEDDYDRSWRMHWYSNRNYDVFAILTGTVRNGRGFAGCDTGDGFYGIVDEPRGLPADVGTWARYATWDHSEGWLSLDEIRSYNWEQKTRKRGVIPLRRGVDPNYEESYEEWRVAKGEPRDYCGGVGGGGVVTVTETLAERLLEEVDLTRGRETYVRVQWTQTYAECARDFIAFVEEMLVPIGDLASTRIVFGFDS